MGHRDALAFESSDSTFTATGKVHRGVEGYETLSFICFIRVLRVLRVSKASKAVVEGQDNAHYKPYWCDITS
jgi:hypothetical protein